MTTEITGQQIDTTETKCVLLYDCNRDKDLKEGEVILVYEDGTTERMGGRNDSKDTN